MNKILLVLLLVIVQPIFSVEFRTLLFTDYYGQIEPSTDYEHLRQRNYIRPELSLDLFNYAASLNLSAEYYYDNFTEEQVPNNFNILREFYISIFFNWGDLLVGQKFTTKSKAEVFSPLNILNASYREVFSLDGPYQSKLAELSAEVRYYLNDDSSLELLYIPFPRTDYQGEDNLDVNLNNVNYTLHNKTDAYLLDNSHSLFLTYNKYSYSFDTQLTYAYYVDGSYNYKLNDDYTIDKTFNRVHTLGGAFSSSLGEVGITEELAINITEDFSGTDPGIKNSDITLNSQFTKTLFGRTYGQLSMIYQYIFNYEKDGSFSDAVYAIHNQPTGNILFFVSHLHDSFLREKLYVALNVGFFFSPNIYIAPRVSYSISDLLKLETGIDMYTGKYKNKVLEDNLGGDNFYIRFKYEI